MRTFRLFRICLFLGIALWQLTAAAADSPWQRIVVIGASASAGFVMSEPFGGINTAKCRLSNYLDAAITAPHSLTNLASALVFMNPEALEPVQVDHALKLRPTLVVAVDFMFWYCYGEAGSDTERAQRFEKGLKLLEQVPCPLIVGTIPDASSATNTGMLGPEQIPGKTALDAANARLKQWATSHTNVVVMPLAEFFHTVMANQAVKLHDETLPAGKTRNLIQNDQLHPTPRGATVLALAILDTLTSSHPEFQASDVRWDRKAVLTGGLAVLVH